LAFRVFFDATRQLASKSIRRIWQDRPDYRSEHYPDGCHQRHQQCAPASKALILIANIRAAGPRNIHVDIPEAQLA
jgi:hypothetical protein